jgi:hypothetical protein
MPLAYRKDPGKIWGLQSHPKPWGRRGWPESGEAGDAPGRGRVQDRIGAQL